MLSIKVKMKNNIITFSAYILMLLIHFIVWHFFQIQDNDVLIKFYIYLSVVFAMVIVLINVFNYLIPNYLGFAVLGIFCIEFMLAFIVKKKFNLDKIPYFRLHFIVPVLGCLVLTTFYSIGLLKNDKKQQF